MATLLQQENWQLKVKHLIQSKPKADLEADKGRGRKVMDFDQKKNMETKTKPRRPKTRGLKRALEVERQSSHPPEQLTFDELISMEINQDKEYWLGRVNEHLEKLLKRAKRDNNLQRHMENHYCAINIISQIRLKQLKKRLKEIQMKLKEKDSLDFLVEASLDV